MVEIRAEKTEEIQQKGEKKVRSTSDTVDNLIPCKKRKVADDVRDIFHNAVREIGRVKEMIVSCEKELNKFQKSICMLPDTNGTDCETAQTHLDKLKSILKKMKSGLVRPEGEIQKFTSHMDKLQEIITVNYDELDEDHKDASMNSSEVPDSPDSIVTSCSPPDSDELSSVSDNSISGQVTSPELKIDTAGESSQSSVQVGTPDCKVSGEEDRETVEEQDPRTGLSVLTEIIQKQIAFQSLPSRINSGETSFCESVSEEQYNHLDVAFQKDLYSVSTKLIQERMSSLAEKYQPTDKILQQSVRILEKYADKAGGGSIYHINKDDVFKD